MRHLPCGLLSPPTTLHTQVASGWRWVLGPTLRVRSSEQVVRARAKECQRNAPAQTKSFKVPRDTPGLVALGVRDPGSLPCTLAPCSCRKWRATARPYDALTALRVFGSGCFAFLHVPDVCFTALPVLPHACCTYGIPEGHSWSVLTETPVVCTLCECLLRSTFGVVSRASAFGPPPSPPCPPVCTRTGGRVKRFA